MAANPDHCPKAPADDPTHCVHWWEGEPCCRCGSDFECGACQDGGMVQDTCDVCNERHCTACEPCEDGEVEC